MLTLAQGTTCVFSKKVEYLHNLVYQALETIFNRKQKEKQAASRQRVRAPALTLPHHVSSVCAG